MSDTFFRPTWAEINLDHIRHNFLQFRKRLSEKVLLMAVVKANAYGHGAVVIGRELLEAGADYLGVATLDEAIELRKAGITAPTLVLGYTPSEAFVHVVKWDITQTVFTDEVVECLQNEAARQNKKVKVHIKVDTGMGRLGLRNKDQIIGLANKINRCENLVLEGIFTHHACADEEDKSVANKQQELFQEIVHSLSAAAVNIPFIHSGNSAVGIDHPDWGCNMVRVGVSLYGFYPSPEVNHNHVNLKQALTLKTRIAYIKDVEEGSLISYGGTYKSKTQEKIVTLPIGYADGYSRLLSNKACVLVNGVEAPLAGRVCMDQIMINVTDVPGLIMQGDEVVLYGEQKQGFISVDRVAQWIGTINYEVVCMLSRRIPRIYIKNKETIHIDNYLVI